VRKVSIRVQECQANNIAAHQLDKAMRGGVAVVSNGIVVKSLLALAKKRGVEVEFYGLDEHLAKKPLDLPGVKRVLDGGEL
jgi:hypothetical protein